MQDCGYSFRLRLSAVKHRTDSMKQSSRVLCKTLETDFTVKCEHIVHAFYEFSRILSSQ
jgi:hypothetical protein